MTNTYIRPRRHSCRLATVALASFFFTIANAIGSHASAESISLSCKSDKRFGTLSVVIDEAQHMVLVTALHVASKPSWLFRHGAFAHVLVAGDEEFSGNETSEQLVIFTPSIVMVGWRVNTGELEYLAWFNRSAMRSKHIPCRWRSAWRFEVV